MYVKDSKLNCIYQKCKESEHFCLSPQSKEFFYTNNSCWRTKQDDPNIFSFSTLLSKPYNVHRKMSWIMFFSQHYWGVLAIIYTLVFFSQINIKNRSKSYQHIVSAFCLFPNNLCNFILV